jgi:hypothetical protein
VPSIVASTGEPEEKSNDEVFTIARAFLDIVRRIVRQIIVAEPFEGVKPYGRGGNAREGGDRT